MVEAPYVYAVLVQVDPDRGGDYVAWLDNKHIADVVGFPGILWARRVRLDEPADDGWDRYFVIYGFESRDVLARYQESELFQSFAEEIKPFEGLFRLQRFFGQVDLEIG